MNTMYKLFFDTETSGLDKDAHNLLTAYFAVCDDSLNVIDDLYLQLKPSDLSKINVTEEAMRINKINLKEHLEDKNTLTYEDASRRLIDFFEKHKISGKKKSLQPCGHNISFDKDFIHKQLMPKEVWEKYVHYRTLDTSTACALLKDWDMLPEYVGSLTSLVDYYRIPMREAHHAKSDVLMNIEVYKYMKNMMKIKKKNISGIVSNNTLLEIVEE